ncbi:MAG: hypothetical protein ACP5HW_02965 [Candidatus Micrarchaeia archaeon]|jgi:hypothetical protein
MKAQISVEFLLYLSAVSLALLAMSSIALHYMPYINEKLGEYATWLLIARINELAAYRDSSSIYAYIPKGLCNSSIENDYLGTVFGQFYINPAIKISKGAFCPDGTYANLSLKSVQGYVILGR